MALKYKFTEKGNITVNEQGHPIVINDHDGDKDPEEFGMDALANYTSIPDLRGEAKNYRTKLKDAEATIATIEASGIKSDELAEWIESAKKALETVKNLADGDLIKAGDVETIKRQAREDLETKLTEIGKRHEEEVTALSVDNESKDETIRRLMIDDQFNTSPFVKEKLAMTPKMARAYFSENFKVEKQENGKMVTVGRYADGEKILDASNNYELAGFEIALDKLVTRDPDRDSLLIGRGNGSGAGDFQRGRTSTIVNPWKSESRNLTEQGRIITTNPELAKTLQIEAGIKTPITA